MGLTPEQVLQSESSYAELNNSTFRTPLENGSISKMGNIEAER